MISLWSNIFHYFAVNINWYDESAIISGKLCLRHILKCLTCVLWMNIFENILETKVSVTLSVWLSIYIYILKRQYLVMLFSKRIIKRFNKTEQFHLGAWLARKSSKKSDGISLLLSHDPYIEYICIPIYIYIVVTGWNTVITSIHLKKYV